MKEPDVKGARLGYGPRGAVRAFVYHLLWWCAEGFYKAASACHYMAAGLLRRDELRASSKAQWSRFNTSAHEVDAALDPWERRFYSRYLRSSDRVLLIGCGAGRDLIALRTAGYDVTGLDQDPALIELARGHLARHGLSAPLIAEPVETAALPDRYDAVVLLTCYPCIQETTTRVETLKRIRAHLAPGGRVLLGYNGFTTQRRSSLWLMRVSTALSRAGWRPERGDVFSRSYTAPRLVAYQHYFRPEDVARECAAAGLRVTADYVEDTSIHCAVATAE